MHSKADRIWAMKNCTCCSDRACPLRINAWRSMSITSITIQTLSCVYAEPSKEPNQGAHLALANSAEEIADANNVGVVEVGEQLDLADHSGPKEGVAEDVRVDALDGHLLAVPGVFGRNNHAI